MATTHKATREKGKYFFKSIVTGLTNDPRILQKLSFTDVVEIMMKHNKLNRLNRCLADMKLCSNGVDRSTAIPIIKVDDLSMEEDRSLLPEPCENWGTKSYYERLMIAGENKNYLNVPGYEYPVIKHKSFDAAYMFKFRKNTQITPSSFSTYFKYGRKAASEKINNVNRRFPDGYKQAKHKFAIRPRLQSVNSCVLIPDQIYRLSQTILYWRSLPTKKSEGTILENSSHRDRLTVLFCTNFAGSHKLRPLVVGSSSDPRVVQHFDGFLVYKYSKDGQITENILNEWFFEHFVPEVSNYLKKDDLPQRSILALDPSVNWHPPPTQLLSNNPSHNINTVKITASIPVEQTVIGLARMQYKKRLLLDAVACPHKLTKLADAIALIRFAWDRVNPFDIDQCCRNILPNEDITCFAKYNPTDMLKVQQFQQFCVIAIRQLLLYLPGGKDLVHSEIHDWIYFDQGLIIDKNPFF